MIKCRNFSPYFESPRVSSGLSKVDAMSAPSTAAMRSVPKHMYIYIYIYIYVHTYIHTFICLFLPEQGIHSPILELPFRMLIEQAIIKIAHDIHIGIKRKQTTAKRRIQDDETWSVGRLTPLPRKTIRHHSLKVGRSSHPNSSTIQTNPKPRNGLRNIPVKDVNHLGQKNTIMSIGLPFMLFMPFAACFALMPLMFFMSFAAFFELMPFMAFMPFAAFLALMPFMFFMPFAAFFALMPFMFFMAFMPFAAFFVFMAFMAFMA